MLWITNHPKSLKGLWPRRAGCVYIEGEPRGTFAYTAEQLREQTGKHFDDEQLVKKILVG
jgi:hypothetical protein